MIIKKTQQLKLSIKWLTKKTLFFNSKDACRIVSQEAKEKDTRLVPKTQPKADSNSRCFTRSRLFG